MAQFESILMLATIFFPLFLSYLYQNRKSPPITNWPIIGMLPGLLYNARRIFAFANDCIRQSGGTCEIRGPWFPSLDFIITADHMNANHILCKNFDNYEKGSEFNEIFFDCLGEGIFNSNSDSWKSQRKVMLLLMKDDKFVLHFQRILHEKLEKSLIVMLEHFMKLGIEVDLQEVLQRFSYDVVCMLAVGLDPNSLSVELSEVPIMKAFTQAEERLLYRHVMPVRLWKLQRWLQIGEEKKLSKALKTVDSFLYQCIASKREKLRCKLLAEEDKYDFVTAFMVQDEGEMTSVDGKSDKFLRDVAVNIMSAGKDTISASLSWFFWLVAMNPSVESKLLQEMRANSPSINDEKNMFFSVEGLKRFVYLDAVLRETLRLYPAVPFNHKTAIQPDILPSGHHINRNTRVLINFYAMGRMEEIWGEDCLEFKPERWISERGDVVHVPSHKFIAFNAGPRSCIGRNISFIQMKLVAISVLWHYQIQVVQGHHVAPGNTIVLHMKNGLKVRIKKRSA
ncbi:alkane hydroxylase MAH1-like [Herrania umbratica]|uniref:Alkane hydroxylase MAH1-like n=1 Tax=Herrania umbratica TaxID=108875 RepID=A0A6J1BI25_9ROSI|nr:alkane hydroxylase MAH1-like [Herrania umbratica]